MPQKVARISTLSLLTLVACSPADDLGPGARGGGPSTGSGGSTGSFPPRKYLRVKVDGGTLEQGGIALAWDSHGCYEVALDAGSLTLSP